MKDIVVVVLASSVVSAIVSWISSVFIQKLSFKQEYHKQLVARRLDAYGMVEIVIKELSGTVVNPVVGADITIGGKVHRIFTSRDRLIEFYALVASAITKSVWLSSEISNTLVRINDLLNKATYEFGLEFKEKSGIGPYLKAGLNCFDDLEGEKVELLAQLRTDLRNLHDIDRFIKV